MNKRLETDIELQNKIPLAMCGRMDPEYLRFGKTQSSGYTYVGQSIAHDIIPITDRLRATREVSGMMDLHSIYDARQNYQLQHISPKDLFFTQEGFFKFAKGNALDFQRDKHGIALIPEGRNDDHVIIAQLHLFWQQFHNVLIDKKFANNALEAKRLVVLTFQLMVIEDYLYQITEKNVFETVISKDIDFLDGNDKLWRDVFRLATFKFGHSVIRNSYSLRLTKDDPMPSRDLNDLFMGHRKPRKMTKDDVIDWRVFFCLKGTDQFEGAMPIDTRISGFMGEISQHNDIAIHIASRNIKSELAAKLPSGCEIANMIVDKLPQDLKDKFSPLTNEHVKEASFNHLGLHIEELTIWLYTLLEAQLAPTDHQLGFVASSVNAHVIKTSIKGASFSVYQNGKYDFDVITKKMGAWGEVLKGFAYENQPLNNSKLTMQNLVNFFNDNK